MKKVLLCGVLAMSLTMSGASYAQSIETVQSHSSVSVGPVLLVSLLALIIFGGGGSGISLSTQNAESETGTGTGAVLMDF